MVFALPRLLLHDTLTPTTLRLFIHGRFRLGCRPQFRPGARPDMSRNTALVDATDPLPGPREYGTPSLVTFWSPTTPTTYSPLLNNLSTLLTYRRGLQDGIF